MVTNIRRALAQVNDDLPRWIESSLEWEASRAGTTKLRRRKLRSNRCQEPLPCVHGS